LISPFLTHTHPWQAPMSWWTKTKSMFDLFSFFYHLSGAL